MRFKVWLIAAIVILAAHSALTARADALEGAASERCYGLLLFIAPDPHTGELVTAAWVVGPFSNEQCAAKTNQLAQAAPSPIQGGRLTAKLYGSVAQLRLDLDHAWGGCFLQSVAGMDPGPDGIRGIWLCAGED